MLQYPCTIIFDKYLGTQNEQAMLQSVVGGVKLLKKHKFLKPKLNWDLKLKSCLDVREGPQNIF